MNKEQVKELQHLLSLFDNITHIEIHGQRGEMATSAAISDTELIIDVIMQLKISLEMEREKHFYGPLTKKKTHIPDWDRIPLRYNYFAIDKGGSAYAFETEPYLYEIIWRMISGDCQYIGSWKASDYKNSLQKRPTNEQPPTS